MTPDDPLIYANSQDPQTWNLYTFVGNNPINRIDPDGHLTIIVPGTHASSGDWNMRMKLVQEARRNFHDNDVRILSWSRAMGGSAVEDGASRLAEIVNAHQFAPGEKLNIIGHSRGGDVALQATWHLDHKIDNLVTLDTPMWSNIGFPIDTTKIGSWLDVYVRPDLVAPLDSGGGTQYPSTFHQTLSCWSCGPIGAHSAPWQNDTIRQEWWEFWLQHNCQDWWDSKTNTLHGCS